MINIFSKNSVVSRQNLNFYVLICFCFLLQAEDGVHIRHIENIELANDGGSLGFGIVGSKNGGVLVKTILPNGVADKVGLSVYVISLLIMHCFLYSLEMTVKNTHVIFQFLLLKQRSYIIFYFRCY